MNPKNNDQLIGYLIQRIEDIDNKVDKLLQFKWQIIGGSVSLSFLITLLVQAILFFIAK